MRVMRVALFIATTLSTAFAGNVHVYDLSTGGMSTMNTSGMAAERVRGAGRSHQPKLFLANMSP